MSPREISLDRTLYSVAPKCPQCNAACDSSICPHDGTSLVTGLQSEAVIAGRYRYSEPLGSGGMGLIVKAYDQQKDTTVAVKMLLFNRDAASVLRFKQEVKASSLLTHENIIRIYDFGTTDDGCPYMVMDYLEGETLAQCVKRDGALPLAEAMPIFRQLCDAMSYAHGKGVIHRDLKPSNIMLIRDEFGRRVAKLVDFGIAKVSLGEEHAEQKNLTQTGQIIGSPMFMSPEQALGRKTDARTDIYSAGCIIYFALTGVAPVEGESMLHTMFKHANEKPLPMSDSFTGKVFSRELEAVVAKALEKEPGARQQSFKQLWQELEHAGDMRPDRGDRGAASSTPSTSFRTRAFVALACLALIGTVIGGILFAVGHPKDDRKAGKNAAPVAALPGKTESTAPEDTSLEKLLPFDTNSVIRAIIDTNIRNQATDFSMAEPGVSDGDVVFLVAKLQEAGKKRRLHLHAIDLSNSSISDAALDMVAKLPFEKLNVGKTHIGRKGIERIGTMQTLRELSLDNINGLPSGSLQPLAKLRNLELLDLGYLDGSQLKGSDVSFLPRLTQLKSLSLENDLAFAGFMKYIQPLRNLESLSVCCCDVDNDGVKNLAQLKKLNTLKISVNKRLNDKCISTLVGLPDLSILNLAGTSITNDGLQRLSAASQLRELDLSECPYISEYAVHRLQAKLQHCHILFRGSTLH